MARTRQSRAERIPLGGHRGKLTVNESDKDPAYVYRWINDSPGRVEQAQRAGYEFVNDVRTGEVGETNTDLGSRTSAVVGRTEDGKGMRGYLMRIPREYYEEDQSAKERVNEKVDEAILGGKVAESDNQYVPKGGISYKP